MEKKYGLQLRVKPSQQKPKHPLPNPAAFRGDDDDDNVEREILKQAHKNRSMKDVEEQQKKALEEDPTVFDYDGVYDQMKQKAARPIAHDKQERKPKYIATLMEKAKQREREHEIVYERKLAKERDQDAHLYADKDKFVTSAYKKKLAEQAKWIEEERIRELQEEKEDVTKKKDITDFYFGLHKNVAFGGGEASQSKKQSEANRPLEKVPSSRDSELESSKVVTQHENAPSLSPSKQSPVRDPRPTSNASPQENEADEPPATEQPNKEHHKRSQDALAEAKQRFLARKKAKDQ